MDFTLHILGCGAALPTTKRNCTAQHLRIGVHNMLIDSGEGTQLALRKNKLSLQKINSIFISHLHGDHFLGLPGLLFSMNLLGRKEPLCIYAPAPLKEIIDLLLKASNSQFVFPVEYINLKEEKSELLFENTNCKVHSFPVLHKIPTWGFLFEDKQPQLKLKKEVLSQYNFTFKDMHNIKMGKDFTDAETGEVIPNHLLTQPPPPPRKYAYCSDTAYTEGCIPLIHGADLLYHEATFAAKDEALATEKLHSTTHQAARLAAKAQVKQLIIGHFSSRYEDEDVEELVTEARTIFPNTVAAYDDAVFEVRRG